MCLCFYIWTKVYMINLVQNWVLTQLQPNAKNGWAC